MNQFDSRYPGDDGGGELYGDGASPHRYPNPFPLGQSPAEHRLRQMVPTSELAGPALERAFLDALQGEPIKIAGRFQVYTSFGRDETVVFIHDPSGFNKHKYIIADVPDHAFIVAAPVSWTPFHARLLDRVIAVTGLRAECAGGGFVEVAADGVLEVNGESGDFGPGDHPRAKAAFERAVSRSGQDD